MTSPETAGVAKPSLAQDWLYALRYWLRGPKGIAVLVVSALVVGAALNWSWLVAVGIAPLLLTVLPCAVMCGLGLCMHKMAGGSCSTSSSAVDHSDTPIANVAPRVTAAPESDNRAPVSHTAGAGTLPDRPIDSAVEPAPEEQPQVLKERE
jgi:hypothetical protein